MTIEKEIFKYYTLDDSKDSCYRPELFKFAYRSKENAIKAIVEYLEGLDLGYWFQQNSIKKKRRPVDGTVKIIKDEWSVKIRAEIEECEIINKIETKSIMVDGKEYINKESKIEEGEYKAVMKEAGGYWEKNLVPVVERYSVYITEKELVFGD